MTEQEFLRLEYPITLTPEKKEQWLKTLRDPASKQITNNLHREGEGRCCLGVISDIQDITKKINNEVNPTNVFYYIFGNNDSSINMPPDLFSGMTEHFIAHLVRLNDQQGKSFKQIARFLEFNVFPSYSEQGIRILNHYYDQYYVYIKESSIHSGDGRFSKHTMMTGRYTWLKYPDEMIASMNRKALKAFLKVALPAKSL